MYFSEEHAAVVYVADNLVFVFECSKKMFFQ